MKYVALLLAYVAVMMNVSYYYQMKDEGVELSFWSTIGYILIPLAILFIVCCLGIVLVSVGMHYKWWRKPESPKL